MSDLGLFSSKRSNVKVKQSGGGISPAPKPEPVVLKPFVPKRVLLYSTMSREEIIAGASGLLLFDIECFPNFFLIMFKSLETGKFITLRSPFDSKKLKWILQNHTCIGFNIIKYDLPMAWLSMITQSTHVLKDASNDLIVGGMKVNDLCAKYGFSMQTTPHIDLIEVCPMHGSLKLYGARLHAPLIQDLPFPHNLNLEDWQKKVVEDYCINDIGLTELLYGELKEQLALRRELTVQYGQDLMSKSDAQIAETVIGSEIQRIRGGWRPRRPDVSSGALKYQPPKNLSFQGALLKGVLKMVCSAVFSVGDNGYIEAPKEIGDFEIPIGGSVYRLGIGGLHSSEKNVAWVAGGGFELIDRDVASYYPAIVINCKLAPVHLGDDFLVVYKGLVARRLEAKKAGNGQVSESLKITVNGTFGKTASPYSIIYAPEMLLQITVSGQLYLLMLIERLEAAGVAVVSANTDGIVMRCHKSKKKAMLGAIKEWEKVTGFVTEETRYRALYSRDVNAYLAIGIDGKVKGKSIFYDPWRVGGSARDLFWRFQKNPSCQICVEAVERFLVNETSIEKTIKGCKDIRRFVAVKNVTGGAHKAGEYLGKVVRWYYAEGEGGAIHYVSNGRIVADTQGARPLMELPASLPKDIDYTRYVQKANEMIEEFTMPKVI